MKKTIRKRGKEMTLYTLCINIIVSLITNVFELFFVNIYLIIQ